MCEVPIQFGIALLAVVTASGVAQAGMFTLTSQAVVPNAIVVSYDPADGNLTYDGNGLLVSTMELKSSSGLFDPSKVNADVIVGPFDVFTSAKFFRLDTAGIARVDIGPVLPRELTVKLLIEDMQVECSFKPGLCRSAPGAGPYLYVISVPEPSSVALVICGVLGLCRPRHQRSALKAHK
jgi:hypothetical protein